MEMVEQEALLDDSGMDDETPGGGETRRGGETPGSGETTGGGETPRGLPDNIVLIGRKDSMRYISAVMMQFNNGASEVVVKARGRAISRAVDVAERVRNQFLPEAQPTDIRITTEEVEGERGTVKVSAIEITLTKK